MSNQKGLFDRATLGVFDVAPLPKLDFGKTNILVRAAVQGVAQGAYNYVMTNKGINAALEDGAMAFLTSAGIELLMDQIPDKAIPAPEKFALETVLQSAAYGAYKIFTYNEQNRQELFGKDHTKAVYDDIIVNGASNIALHWLVGK